jgi:cysteine desulfurase / selenocysteine lyase
MMMPTARLANQEQTTTDLNIDAIRRDFPLIADMAGKGANIYFDNAASAQKPRCVMDSMSDAAFTRYANVHRGAHWLSGLATASYEGARARLRAFLNAPTAGDIIFTKSATESINLVAAGFASIVVPGDEIIVSALDHHANLVPWHMLRQRRGVVLRWVDPDPLGNLNAGAFADAITPRTRLIAVTHMSNVMGVLTPLDDIVRLAHDRGVPVLADGTQAAVHHVIDVDALDVDFYAFTGHKLYGPTGIGALYAKNEWIERLPPMLGGGEMVDAVSRDHVDYASGPHKFEAGTPPILEAIGLAVALDYVEGIGRATITEHETMIGRHARQRLAALSGITIFGDPAQPGPILTFASSHAHADDIAAILDSKGICVRAGAHCTQPLHQMMGVSSTCRASFAMYSTLEEVDAFADALEQAVKTLQ